VALNEVAPPGFGHTKGDKKKGVEKGGTAAAFDRARKEGRFKGSKSDMFAIMWSQKNKGDNPHYKPGTDKKYKKYQEEIQGGISMQDYDPNMKFREYEFIDVIKAEPLKKTISENSYEKLKKKIGSKKMHKEPALESFEIDKSAHKKAQKKSKMRNLAKGNTNPNEKAAAEKKAGGPKLYGEEKNSKGRHPRDQKELERAQEYIKKNPNFGKKEVKEEASYRDFTKRAREASARVNKEKQDRKDANAQSAYRDKVTKGVKFYDKKGSGRMRGGRKHYD